MEVSFSSRGATSAGTADNAPEHAALLRRFDAIGSRLAAAERALGIAPQNSSVAGISPAAAPSLAREAPSVPAADAASASAPAAMPDAAAAMAAPHSAAAWRDTPPGPTQRRLQAELEERGVVPYSFLRVVEDYYERSLMWRRECLGAPSVFHLCKSIVMENTRAAAAPCEQPLQRYFLVILQYASAINPEKLKKVLHRAANRTQAVGKQHFNPRLVPEAVNDELTGFSHNAVSPVGLATRLPIIMSDRVAALQPPVFWLGGGEPDLKVCLPLQPFLNAYAPVTVVDCTNNNRTIADE